MERAFLLLSIFAATLPVRAVESGNETEARPIQSAITQVTVYADRAQVFRAAEIPLGGEVERVAFAKLPGWIDEGSVRVTMVPPGAGEILDVQVQRTFLARASDEQFRKAEAAVQELTDQVAALDDEKAVLEAQATQVDAIRMFSLEKLPRDTATREVKPAEYNESVRFVTGSLREMAVARRDLEKKKRDLQPELTARQRALEELRQKSQLEERTVVVTLKGKGRGSLHLAYMIPGATWEPVHELRATPGSKSVSITSQAVVRQTTGEDWSGASLALSTQRSTETMKIPELDALLVGANRKIARLSSQSKSSFAEATRNFDVNNSIWFNANNPSVLEQQEFIGNRALLADNIKRVEQLFEAVLERGTTAHFPAIGKQMVRTDGRPVRVLLGQLELDAQHRVIAAPEASLNAARTVDLANTAKQSLLPGKVSIYLDGAFLGLTETDFVAPGESFALYLGVADEIKLSRTLDKKRSELKRGGQRTKVLASFLVSVENLSDKPVSVQLADRVPVSESDEVKVSSVKITPEGKPDARGLLRWDLSLGPKQSREFRVEYTIEYPNDLPARKAAAGAAPAPLQMQIESLERKF
jgi:uncharacterized protein (TIGR02231 family)